jgi:hypothetical protein
MPKSLIDQVARRLRKRKPRGLNEVVAIVGDFYIPSRWTLTAWHDHRDDGSAHYWIPEVDVYPTDADGWDRELAKAGLHRKTPWQWDPDPRGGGSWDADCYLPDRQPPARSQHP